MGVLTHLAELLNNLYNKNTNVVKLNGELTEPFHSWQRSETKIRSDIHSLSIGGKDISSLRYADYTTLLLAPSKNYSKY